MPLQRQIEIKYITNYKYKYCTKYNYIQNVQIKSKQFLVNTIIAKTDWNAI